MVRDQDGSARRRGRDAAADCDPGGYALVERIAEREHMPLAAECGLGLVPWSPLAGGFLTGKYDRDGEH